MDLNVIRLFVSSIVRFSATTILFVLCSLSLNAQDLDDVTITGRVLDQNGAVIPGATVKAKQIATNKERTAIANGEGRYRFVELEPGGYELVASFKNFQDTTIKDLKVIAAQNVQLDITLYPQGVTASTTVEVSDEALLVDTTRTIVGGTVTQREVEELPINTRSPLDLVLVLGGTTEEPLSNRNLAEDKGARGQSGPSRTPEEAGLFGLSGGTAYSNNLTIDGLDNNDDRAATFRFQPSLEAVEEVQVITNQFSAEYGRASGGRINLRTRSGTRKFSGRLFYFFRDESLNANTWKNNQRGISRPALQDNNPGFTFGGPVPFGYFKNKTFFFAAYEHGNIYEETVIDTYVPVAQNPIFPLPQPTDPNATVNDNGAFIAPFVQGVETPLRNHIFTGRIDHNFNDRHNVTFNYQMGRRRDFRQFSGGSRLAEALVGSSRNTDAYNFADNFIFSAKAVNQFRFQYSILEPAIETEEPTSPVALIDLPTVLNRGSTLIAGSSTSNSTDRREKRWQFQDTFNYVADKRTFRFGVDVQRIISTFIDKSDATGTFNFDHAQDFLNNRFFRYRHNFGNESTQRNTYLGVFFQDDWRIHPRLLLSYGLRYERETILDDNNNWGPRFALAYAPFKDGKGVIRFGAGVTYNRVLLRTIDDFTLGENQIFFDTNDIPAGATRDAVLAQIRFPQPITQDAPFVAQYGQTNTSFSRRLDQGLRIPESYQTNAGFEREIGKGFVFEANYTWNRTAHLWREFNANAARVPTGFSDFASYLLSQTFNNAAVNNVRPLYNANGARDFIRFALSFTPPPVGDPARCAGTIAPSNSEQGGCMVINGVPTTIINLNSLTATNASAPITVALAAIQRFRPDPTRTQIEQLASIGDSFYHGLVLELRSRSRKFKNGFATSFRAVYTLSNLRDDGIVNTSSAQIAGDFNSELSRSLLDRRHRFVLSGTFDMPSWLGRLKFSPIIRVASAAPFNVSAGGIDRNLDDVNTDRPNFNGDLNAIRSRKPGDPVDENFVNAFSVATIGRAGGNLGRNAGLGPVQFLFDLSVTREFRFGEKIKLRPVIEFDNILNATVFSFGSEFINFSALSPTATPQQRQAFLDSFLVPTRTLRPRQIRLGLRFDF
jgi:hypothetical protein